MRRIPILALAALISLFSMSAIGVASNPIPIRANSPVQE